MANFKYYAVLYVYDKDGSEKASMPCFTEADVLRHGSKHPKVKVVREGKPAFWISFKKEWVLEFNKSIPTHCPDDFAMEWGSSNEDNNYLRERAHTPTTISDQFYDGWGHKKTKS